MSLTLFVLGQATTAISWTKVIGLAWPIVASVGGVIASIWATGKVTEARLDHMRKEIDDLESEVRYQRDKLVLAEKEIALTLKNIEVKLGELTATVALVMNQERPQP